MDPAKSNDRFLWRRRGWRVVFGWMVATVGGLPAWGLDLTIDYSRDAVAEDFFGRFPQAKLALEQAASDLSALIATEPTAISQEYFEGLSGNAAVGFDLDMLYRDPSTGVIRTVAEPFRAAGEVILYVGSQHLTGNTLAFSEIATVKNTVFWNGDGTAADVLAAAGMAAGDAEASWRRGQDSPVYNTLTGPLNIGGNQVPLDADMGPIAASVWFDTDTNNNGDSDSNAQLAAYWHFDHTTPVPSGKFDFYTAALHEIVHGLGFGTAEAYNDLYGTSSGEPFWLGPTAQYLNGGSPFNLTDIDARHLRDGLFSPRLSDGTLQETLLDHDIQAGVRKGVTLMDAAFLQDIGWTLTNPIVIPEPSALAWLGLVLGLRRRRPQE